MGITVCSLFMGDAGFASSTLVAMLKLPTARTSKDPEPPGGGHAGGMGSSCGWSGPGDLW